MTEVRKPGGNSKVASVPYVSNSKLEWLVIDHFPIIFFFFLHNLVTLSNLKISLQVPKASKKLQKNF